MNIICENREMEGERLEFADKEGIYFLGPNLTLRRCNVVLCVPGRWLHILPTRIIDCAIEVKQELKNSASTVVTPAPFGCPRGPHCCEAV